MDKLLVSGNGKGNSAIWLWSIVYLLSAAVGGAIMYVSTLMKITKKQPVSLLQFKEVTVQDPMAEYVFYIGLILAVCMLICIPVIVYCIRKTKIDVYESYLEGICVGKYFLFGDFRTKYFKFAYDQITSFDATGSSITIRIADTNYSCYAKNANEIQSAIFNQKQGKGETK